MFGYIKPFKPQLKICEYEMYKSVYCGLCGQLGKSFGPAARLTLSYDFTFLSMLHYGVNGAAPAMSPHRCYVNPLKKRVMCQHGEELRFASDTAILMLYYKLLDNMHDGGVKDKLVGTLLRPVVGRAFRKASGERPRCGEILAGSIERQRALEERLCASIDEASAPTAGALGQICGLLSKDPSQKRVLERVGYLVGRFVYLCDALDDLEEDLKAGGYNPLLLRYGLTKDTPQEELEGVCTVAKESLYATIAEAAKAYDLLEVAVFHPVLQNIFYLGMRASVNEILSKKEQNR